MANTERVTITLPADLLAQARSLSEGNLSQFISTVVRDHIEQARRRQLREELIASYIAKAEEDLAMVNEFRYVDYETTMKYVPPSPELELVDADELPAAG